MARRRLIIKHLDPLSVLRFGAIANAALFIVFLVLAGIVWVVINQFGLIDRSCDIASDVGFRDCGLRASTYFLTVILVGILAAVVHTAVLVFFAFLHNLIADLTGGIVVGVIVEGGNSGQVVTRDPRATPSTSPVTRQSEPPPTQAMPRPGPDLFSQPTRRVLPDDVDPRGLR